MHCKSPINWGQRPSKSTVARRSGRPIFPAPGAAQLRKLFEDLNLRVAAIGFPTRRGYNVAEYLEGRVAATKDAMRMAYELGSSIVVNQVGRVPASRDAPDWPIMLEALTDLGTYGHRIGATLTAETGSESGEDLARLIAALPDGSLGATFNPGNLIINGFVPLDAVAAFGRHILYVHAKDGVRDLARGRGDEVPLGAVWPISLRFWEHSKISATAATCASSATAPRTLSTKSASP